MLGWSRRCRPGLRPGALRRQYRRAAARPAGAPADRDRARPHRRRLADRRGPRDGAHAGAAAGAGRACSAEPAAKRPQAAISSPRSSISASGACCRHARQGRRLRHRHAVVGRRVIPWVLHYVAHTGSRELFRLAVRRRARRRLRRGHLFGVSLALGAFFAGMIMANPSSAIARRRNRCRSATPSRCCSSSRSDAVQSRQPVRRNLADLATLFIIVIGKSVAAFLIVVASAIRPAPRDDLGEPGADRRVLLHPRRARRRLEPAPEQGRDLILAGAILSIMLNPLAFAPVGPPANTAEETGRNRRAPPRRPRGSWAGPDAPTGSGRGRVPPPKTALDDHTILVGYGRVGSLIGHSLKDAELPFLAIEDADNALAKLRSRRDRDLTATRQRRKSSRRPIPPAPGGLSSRSRTPSRGGGSSWRASGQPGDQYHRAGAFRRGGQPSHRAGRRYRHYGRTRNRPRHRRRSPERRDGRQAEAADGRAAHCVQ